MPIDLDDIGIQSSAVTELTSLEVDVALKAVGPIPNASGGFAFAGKVDPTMRIRLSGAGDLPAALDNLGTTTVTLSNHGIDPATDGVQITVGIDENEDINNVNTFSVDMEHYPGAS